MPMFPLLSLLLALVAPPARASDLVTAGEIEISTSPADAVDEARKALDSGDFTRAAELYEALANAGGGAPAWLACAVARYEAGELRSARTAAEAALKLDPRNLAAQNVLGLILVDGGAVAAGIEKLVAAEKAAAAPGHEAVHARVLVNLGLARLDQGDTAGARDALGRARTLAEQVGDGATAAAAARGISAAQGLEGTEVGVGSMLGKGDLKGARSRAEAERQSATRPRDKVLAALDLAAVERAEGNLDGAASRLAEAVRTAREAGMTREVAVGLGQLGLVYSLGGRLPIAADTLTAGVKEAEAGGYRVVEVDLRCEAGLVLAQLDRLADAEEQQRRAGVLLAGMSYPQGAARQAELGGEIAARRGDLATASSALGQAVAFHEKLGHPLDGARVATRLSAAWEPHDRAKADQWSQRAVSLFSQAGDPLGSAHVALARGLADARAKKLEDALRWFAAAAEAAGKQSSQRAQVLARVAREDAAATLVNLGSKEQVERLASEEGVGDLVLRAQKLQVAFESYDTGLAAYQAAKFSVARDRFVAARQLFDEIQEPAYALRARRAAAWAQYNTVVALPAAQAYPQWTSLVEESSKVEDPELYARVYGAAAVTAHTLGQGDPTLRLQECTKMSERLGLSEVAARCHGALAERPGDLDKRAKEARAAFALEPANAATVYALYAVAVDAYNAGRNDLALELAKLARPNAGQLAAPLDTLLQALAGGS